MMPRLLHFWLARILLLAFSLFVAACSSTENPTPVSSDDYLSVTSDDDDGNRGDCKGDRAWSLMVSGTSVWMWGVWGSSRKAVHAVGNGGTTLFFGGDSNTQGAFFPAQADWETFPSGTTADLCDAWAHPNGTAVAVGLEGTVLYFDGKQWNVISGPASGGDAGSNLFGVWGAPDGSVAFAVGAQGTVLTFDGGTLRELESGVDIGLFGIWGASRSDVHIVGVAGTVLHYNGASFDAPSTIAGANLTDAFGTSAKNVYAVGDRGTFTRYNGASWTSIDSGVDSNLFGVWAAGKKDVFVVGAGGTILHYDGAAWTAMESPVSEDLFNVWGTSPCDAFAVGARGTILRLSLIE